MTDPVQTGNPSRWPALLVALLGFAVLLIVGATWSIPRIEDDLTTRAEQELAAAGIDDVAVEFDGRDGTVTGIDADLADEELDSLRGARSVDAEVVSPPPPPPTTTQQPPAERASMQMTRQGVVVGLEGTVRSGADRDALIEAAAAAGFDVEEAIVVDPDIDGSDVPPVVALIGPLLDGSEDGEFVLQEGSVVVTGTAADPVEAEEIDAAIEEVEAGGLDVRSEVTILELSEEVQIVALQEEINQIFELARAIEGQNPNFGTSDGDLNQAAKDILDRVIVAMRRYPLPAADIIGHTDSTGSEATNQTLSEQRAAAVMTYLTENGVDVSRLSATGAGEAEPVATNDTDEGRAENRRVDFLVRKREN